MAYSITVDVSAIVDGQNADAADVTTPIANLKTAVQDLGNGVSAPEQFRLAEIAKPSDPASGSYKLYINSTDHKLHKLTPASVDTAIETVASQVCNARLTLTSGTAVTTSDVTAATNTYVTPYKGNQISLYDGSSAWTPYTFTEITISIAGQAADKNYDVFVYLSGGNVVAETVAWTNDSTRATALVLQDGVYVKSGTTTKRYIGTYRTTSTIGQTEDSISKRYVWNYYHRVTRPLLVIDTTDSWTYATATWRSWNNSTSNRVSFVLGVAEDVVILAFDAIVAGTSTVGAVAIGLDSTSTPTSGHVNGVNAGTTNNTVNAEYSGVPAAGYHFLQLLEIAATAATVTFQGDAGTTNRQSGAEGMLAA